MKKFFDNLSEKLLPIANKLSSNRYLTVLRDSFMVSLPLTMFGSVLVVLCNLPFLNSSIRSNLLDVFASGVYATLSILTVFIVIGIGYFLAKSFEVDAIFGGVIAFASFLIVTPFYTVLENGDVVHGVISLDRLGAKGMFIGMIAAFLSSRIYSALSKTNLKIKMPDSVPPAVAKSFASLIPSTITLLIFVFINAFVTNVLNDNLHDIIYEVLQLPLVGLGASLGATIIALFFVQILWFFGLHGQTLVNSVMDPIWNTLMLENAHAFSNGEKLPHIITKTFMETFTVGLGGSGMTLAVVLIMAFVMKKKMYKDVGKLALGSGIFNVNEPVIFGLPIVLNATILIPWVLAPIVVTIFNYSMMSIGIVPLTTGVNVPWTTPIFFSGMLATNSIMGGILQIIDMFIVAIIWYPFLRILDKETL